MDALTPVSLRVDPEVIAAYAELTNDFNPLHMDPEFAARSPFGGIIAHGTMSLNLIWQAVTATFGPAAAENAELDVRFTRPVRVGDLVTAGGEPDGEGRWRVWSRTADGQPVIEGVLTLAEGVA